MLAFGLVHMVDMITNRPVFCQADVAELVSILPTLRLLVRVRILYYNLGILICDVVAACFLFDLYAARLVRTDLSMLVKGHCRF